MKILLHLRAYTAGTRYIQINKDTDRRIYTEWEQLKRGHGLRMQETAQLIADRLSNEVEATTVLRYIYKYFKGHNPHTEKHDKTKRALDAMLEAFKEGTNT